MAGTAPRPFFKSTYDLDKNISGLNQYVFTMPLYTLPGKIALDVYIIPLDEMVLIQGSHQLNPNMISKVYGNRIANLFVL